MATRYLGGEALVDQDLVRFGQMKRWVEASGSAENLSTFHAALIDAQNGTGACNVLVLGASRVEGLGVTARAARWTEQFLTSLRGDFQPTGIPGGAPNIHNSDGITFPLLYTTSGTVSAYNLANPFGRAWQMTSAGSITFTVFGTSVDILALYAPGTGVFSVTLDGTNLGTLNTATSGGIVRDMNHFRLSLNGRGQHTVSIGWVSGTVVINGVRQYDGDETVGVRLFEAGHIGWQSSTVLAYDTGAGLGNHMLQDLVSEISPHLIIIDDLVGNDSQAVPATTTAASVANYRSIILLIRAVAPTASIVIGLPYNASFPQNPTIASFNTALRAMQAGGNPIIDSYTNTYINPYGDGDPSLHLLDETLVMPDPVTDTRALYVDGVHPSNKGATLQAGYIASALTQSIQGIGTRNYAETVNNRLEPSPEIGHVFQDGQDVGSNLSGKLFATGQTMITTGSATPVINYYVAPQTVYHCAALSQAGTGAWYLMGQVSGTSVISGGGRFRFRAGTATPATRNGAAAIGAFTSSSDLTAGAAIHIAITQDSMTISIETSGTLTALIPIGRKIAAIVHTMANGLIADGSTTYEVAYAIDRINGRAVVRGPDGMISVVVHPGFTTVAARYAFWEGIAPATTDVQAEWVSTWADSLSVHQVRGTEGPTPVLVTASGAPSYATLMKFGVD